MEQRRSILVGVDFTPGSAAALRHAVRLAKESGAAIGPGGVSIRAMHVINTYVVVDLERALSPMQKNIQASLEAEARREWLKFDPALPDKELIELVIRVGNPAAALVEEATASRADLLALGIHRAPGAESGVGTVAGMCVRKSTCPVLLVRPEQPTPFRRVMACVDMSGVSRRVVLDAARLARVENAALDIVHVFEPPWRQLHYFAPMPENSPEFQAGYRALMTSKLREFFEPLKAQLEGLTCQFKLEEHRSAGRGIIEYAVKNDVDIIVLGTHGRNGLKEVLLGSTAERLLKQTPCSMMTIRQSQE